MSVLGFLKWDDFSKDNSVLHKHFGGSNVTSQLNLKINNGFFICPEDKVNKASSLKHITTDKSIIEVFGQKYPQIYRDIQVFYNLTEGFDRLDYTKFKNGAKLAYFFAGAYYIYSNKLADLTKIEAIYSEEVRLVIEKNMSTYLQEFVKLASQHKVNNKIFALFPFAIKIITETAKNLSIPTDFSRVTAFLSSMKYNPYGNLVGTAFEEEVQRILEENNTSINYLSSFVHSYVGQDGVLLSLDTDKAFKDFANKKANGISVPDYLFITSAQIIPIDLKANLIFAKDKQVSGENLKALFTKTAEKTNVIFKGFKVENIMIN